MIVVNTVYCNRTLLSGCAEQPITLAIAYDVSGFHGAHMANKISPIPGTEGFTWWYKIPSWGILSPIILWLNLDPFHMYIF